MRINASPISPELADAYVKMGTYLVARLGTVIAERLKWENASKLAALVDRLRADAEAAFSAAKAMFESDDGGIEPPSGSGGEKLRWRGTMTEIRGAIPVCEVHDELMELEDIDPGVLGPGGSGATQHWRCPVPGCEERVPKPESGSG